jgi:hypothetical protein
MQTRAAISALAAGKQGGGGDAGKAFYLHATARRAGSWAGSPDGRIAVGAIKSAAEIFRP